MFKKQVRCYETFLQVDANESRYPIYFVTHDGFANFSLAICISCGEIFVIDWENPATKGLGLHDLAGKKSCPTCKSRLSETIREYPNTIRLPNGALLKFNPPTIIPPDDESLVLPFFELTPT